jgi:hypothetical protein
MGKAQRAHRKIEALPDGRAALCPSYFAKFSGDFRAIAVINDCNRHRARDHEPIRPSSLL